MLKLHLIAKNRFRRSVRPAFAREIRPGRHAEESGLRPSTLAIRLPALVRWQKSEYGGSKSHIEVENWLCHRISKKRTGIPDPIGSFIDNYVEELR